MSRDVRLYRATVEVEVYFLSDGAAVVFDAISAAEEALGDGSDTANAYVTEVKPSDAVPSEWRDAYPYGATSSGVDQTVAQIVAAMAPPSAPAIDPNQGALPGVTS